MSGQEAASVATPSSGEVRPVAASALFRRALLDRLASPEQLNHAMRITDPRSWLALLGCAVILAAGLTWGFLGRVPSKLGGSGILLHGAGLSDVVAISDGQLTSILVEPGSLVAPGQLVARIAQPELRARIADASARVAELETLGDAAAKLETPSLALSRQTLVRLRAELTERERVTGTVEGRVVEVRAAAGDLVAPGTPIVSLERTGERAPLEALVYVESRVGKAIRPGMVVELEPSVVRRERFGVLLGRVRRVESFPATRQGMMRILRNDQLVESLASEVGGAPLAVHVELEPAATSSGYRWSSGAGPELELTSGTRCAAAITTRVQRPVSLFFPGLDGGD